MLTGSCNFHIRFFERIKTTSANLRFPKLSLSASQIYYLVREWRKYRLYSGAFHRKFFPPCSLLLYKVAPPLPRPLSVATTFILFTLLAACSQFPHLQSPLDKCLATLIRAFPLKLDDFQTTEKCRDRWDDSIFVAARGNLVYKSDVLLWCYAGGKSKTARERGRKMSFSLCGGSDSLYRESSDTIGATLLICFSNIG